jgi:hypothetical protein
MRHRAPKDPADLLTPFERRVADMFLADPLGGSAARAYSSACEALGIVAAKNPDHSGREILEKPAANAYMTRRRAELAEAMNLTQERVLLDLMELRDMCMARKPTPMAAFHDGGLVSGAANKLDAGGAARALELLGRYLAMWTDNVKHTGDSQPPALFVLNLGGPADALPPPAKSTA